MKKVFIGAGTVVVIVGIFVVLFPPQKISFSDGGSHLIQYVSKCRGVYIEQYNRTDVDGGRGGYCFGKIVQVENPRYNPPISKPTSVIPPKISPKPPVVTNPGVHTLSNGKVGVAYNASLYFDYSKDPQGTRSFHPALVSGAFPQGVSLGMPMVMSTADEPASEIALNDQSISGTPTTSGVFTFTVRYNENPYYAETYSLTVLP